MYCVAARRTDANAEMANASAEFAFRVLCLTHGYKLWAGENTWVCKVPDKLGNMENWKRFYENYPLYIENFDRIPDEREAVEYYKETLKGDKESMGFGFLKATLEENQIPFDLFQTKII